MTATIKLNNIFKSREELDSLYRSTPTYLESKIIKAVGKQYYLDYIHCMRDSAIVSTKDEKNFLGIIIVGKNNDIILGYAMGNTDGRELFRINYKTGKVSVSKLRENIINAMLTMNKIRRK